MVFATSLITSVAIPEIYVIRKNNRVNFEVKNVTVSSFNINSSRITGEWDCQFLIENSNKHAFTYSFFHIIFVLQKLRNN